MNKEVTIDHSKLRNPETIGRATARAFAKKGLDIHTNEVAKFEDDHVKKHRIYKLRNVKYFDMGRGR